MAKAPQLSPDVLGGMLLPVTRGADGAYAVDIHGKLLMEKPVSTWGLLCASRSQYVQKKGWGKGGWVAVRDGWPLMFGVSLFAFLV